MTTRRAYPTDLTDAQWEHLEPLLPARRDPRGAKPIHARRELLNAIFSITQRAVGGLAA